MSAVTLAYIVSLQICGVSVDNTPACIWQHDLDKTYATWQDCMTAARTRQVRNEDYSGYRCDQKITPVTASE